MKKTLGDSIRSSRPAVSLAKKHAPHVVTTARAGTGKTFTTIVGVAGRFRHLVPGLWDQLTSRLGFNPVPTPQQLAVWDAMSEGDAKTIRYCAFNKAIVTEFQHRWGWMIDLLAKAGITLEFSTMHSMGYSAVRRAFSNLRLNADRVSDLVSVELGQDIREIRKKRFTLLRATESLVGLSKMNLACPEPEVLADLAAYYDIDLADDNGRSYRAEIFDLVPKILLRCEDPTADGCLDFNDMIWLPVRLDLPVWRSDELLGDEVQDWNRCQQELALKAGKRLLLVGDDRQAIYGFAGADCDSIERMTERLGATAAGVKELKLTFTRRCCKAVVRAAAKIVPDFEAFPENPEGAETEAIFGDERSDPKTTYHASVKDGDVILCRVNAPLVSQCFRFLKAGRKANIRGRDVGAGLISTIRKLKAADVTDLIAKISDWAAQETEREQRKRNPSEGKLIAIQDRADCVVCFTEGATAVDEVVAKINAVFSDETSGAGILLSSIHKSKGLEWGRVFFINTKDAPCPHPMAKKPWARKQEQNLLYVGTTRAISELIWVR